MLPPPTSEDEPQAELTVRHPSLCNLLTESQLISLLFDPGSGSRCWIVDRYPPLVRTRLSFAGGRFELKECLETALQTPTLDCSQDGLA